MAKATDKRKGWLAKLKVGDELGVHDGRAGIESRTYRIVKVERLSPSGRIFATKGYEFHPDGRGVGSDIWHGFDAVEPTEAFRAQVRRQNIEAWVAKYTQNLDRKKVQEATDSQLHVILNTLKPFMKE